MTKRFLGLSNDFLGFIFCKVPVFKTPNVCPFFDFFDADEFGVRVPSEQLTGDTVVPAADAENMGDWCLSTGVEAAITALTVVISVPSTVGERSGDEKMEDPCRQETGLDECRSKYSCAQKCTEEGANWDGSLGRPS